MRALSPTILSRRDADTAQLVDRAVHTQQWAGTPAAAALLARAGVDAEVAARVLSMPRQRRGCVNWSIARTQ
jgi:hypothetical protein